MLTFLQPPLDAAQYVSTYEGSLIAGGVIKMITRDGRYFASNTPCCERCVIAEYGDGYCWRPGAGICLVCTARHVPCRYSLGQTTSTAAVKGDERARRLWTELSFSSKRAVLDLANSRLGAKIGRAHV